MSDMSERDQEEFKLDLALHMPAQGEGFGEWARNNPEDEYALWMAIRHPEDEIEQEMVKRVNSAEMAPKWTVGRAAVLAVLGGGLEVATIGYTATGDMKIGNTFVVSVLSLLVLKGARDIIKRQLPEVRAYAMQERELFERGVQARNTAKMILGTDNN